MARKRKQDDPLAALMKTATKEKLVDLLVLVASSRPAVRHECLDYLTRHTALSHNQKIPVSYTHLTLPTSDLV